MNNYQKQLDTALEVTGRVADQRGILEDDAVGWQELAYAAGMHDNGPYRVLGAWTNDEVTVVLEQNTSPDTAGGPLVSYSPTVVVERHSDGVRVSAAGGDEDVLNFVLDDLAAPQPDQPRARRGARAR